MITISILILIVAKALPVLNTHISSIHVTRITSIVFLFAGALTLNILKIESIGSGVGIYSGFFQVTTISQLIEIFLFLIGGLILIAWPLFKQTNTTPAFNSFCFRGEGAISLTDKHSTDYSLVVLFSSLGSSLLISSYDLISVYLSIELQSFGLYVLSTLYRDSESSTSAGLKYFLLGGLSSCIILLGIGIIYSYTGTTNLESLYIINSVIDINQQYIVQGINLGLSLIFIGFLFKIAAAPLHNWSPDVYDGTPTIVTTWLTIIPKIAILFILLEIQVKLGSFGPCFNSTQWATQYDGYFVVPALNQAMLGGSELNTIINNSGYSFGVNILKTLLLISATLSLIIGSLLGLAQIRIKRLLAYSTITHLGFILLALAVNTEQSIDSFIFYIIQYTITNLNIFLIILGLSYCLSSKIGVQSASTENKDISLISEFKGLFFSNSLLSISLTLSLFSMAGIPPLIGFFSKQLVLYSALQNGYYFITVVAIIVSVISCSYYLQIIKVLSEGVSIPLMEQHYPITSNVNGEAGKTGGTAYKIENNLTNTHSYLISTLTLTILFFFIKPSLILNSTQLLSLSLFYI
jgi:NADH-ubiquinone oxidoreductase chain 2